MTKIGFYAFIILVVGVFFLSACGSDDYSSAGELLGNDSQVIEAAGSQETETDEVQEVITIIRSQEPEQADRLNAVYPDALTVRGQLALGILQLEETDLAVDETAAAELLPLWQALQSLLNSDTTAAIELEAVVNQIQDSMATEQIRAIADMKLTEDSLETLMAEGGIGFGRGAAGGFTGDGVLPEELPEGFVPPDLGGGVPGSGPGGGQGRGPGGGIGGGPGGGFANLDEDARATRQAEFVNGGNEDVQDRALVGLVVRSLQRKIDDTSERFGVFETVFIAISQQTGLSVKEIQEQSADGISMADIIETNGGDLQTIRALLIERINSLPNSSELDVDQVVDDWLGLTAD